MTTQQIAQEVFNQLDRKSISILKGIENKEDTIQFHHTLGRVIRNQYHLWADDCALTKDWHDARSSGDKTYIEQGVDNHPQHPDAVSMNIIHEIWALARAN